VHVFLGDEQTGIVVRRNKHGINSSGAEGLVHQPAELLFGDLLWGVGVRIEERV
jgi:hypothetical protein